MAEVIIKQDKINMLPCPNCKVSCEEKMHCPLCKKEFCGNCFLEIPEGDGRTIKCPGCKEKLNLPKA